MTRTEFIHKAIISMYANPNCPIGNYRDIIDEAENMADEIDIVGWTFDDYDDDTDV